MSWEQIMPKTTLPTRPALPALLLTSLLALSACGGSAKNEQAEAAATIAADSNATMAKAVTDVNAAADQAIGGDEPGNADEMIGDAGNSIEE